MDRDLVSLFVELARISSPSGDERVLGEYIIRRLENVADEARFDGYKNVYARLNGTGKPILFLAHMDTVRPAEKIMPRIRKGIITSDGSSVLGADNKSAVAAIIDAIVKLRKTGRKHRTIEAVFTRSEEIRSYGAKYFNYKLLKAKDGFCIDANMKVGTIISGSPCYVGFELNIRGKSVHASRPEDGRNALLAFNAILNRIRIGRINRDTTSNIGVVHSGYVRNSIPANLQALGEVRSFNMYDIRIFKMQLASAIAAVQKEFGVKCLVAFDPPIAGYRYAKGSKEWKLVKSVSKSMKRVGVSPVVTETWGSTDANVFMDRGIKCVVIGDGAESAHTVNERLKVSELRKLSDIVVDLATSGD